MYEMDTNLTAAIRGRIQRTAGSNAIFGDQLDRALAGTAKLVVREPKADEDLQSFRRRKIRMELFRVQRNPPVLSLDGTFMARCPLTFLIHPLLRKDHPNEPTPAKLTL